MELCFRGKTPRALLPIAVVVLFASAVVLVMRSTWNATSGAAQDSGLGDVDYDALVARYLLPQDERLRLQQQLQQQHVESDSASAVANTNEGQRLVFGVEGNSQQHAQQHGNEPSMAMAQAADKAAASSSHLDSAVRNTNDHSAPAAPPAAGVSEASANVRKQIAYDLSRQGYVFVAKPVIEPRTIAICGVSHTNRFIFVHVLKAAGSSVLFWLYLVMCQPSDVDPSRFSKLHDAKCPAHQKQHFFVHTSGCRDILNKHPDYFRFSFVRHPETRAYSVWKFAKFWHDSSVGQHRLQPLPSYHDWLASDDIFETLRGATTMSMTHVFSQCKFVFDDGGRPAQHFIGRVERMAQAWQALGPKLSFTEQQQQSILRFIRDNVSMNVAQAKKSAPSSGQSGTDAAGTEAAASLVRKHYPNDYDWLGYS